MRPTRPIGPESADSAEATSLYYHAGKSLYDNRLPSWCSEALDSLPGGRHFAEFSLTGKKMVLITRDPEQIKAILDQVW